MARRRGNIHARCKHLSVLPIKTRDEKLVGIAIEYPKNAAVLIGVRMSVVAAALAKAYPDIADLLPKPARLRVYVTLQQ
jgi:hypothetical protein